MPSYGTVDRDYGARLARGEERDGAIYMLNLMKYREQADYGSSGDGAADPPPGGPCISGREADDRYTPVDVLSAVGASICFAAEVTASAEGWDRVGAVRYPTRRSFVDMQSRRDFRDRHVHKEAGMQRTIVMGTLPASGLPGPSGGAPALLELWDGTVPRAVVPGAAVSFEVEGTIVGDGRSWSGARYTPLDEHERIDLSVSTRAHQLLVLQPRLERWT